ncbi:RNA-directed DNA polymerase, eukaryota [Tanacetum coccineum]
MDKSWMGTNRTNKSYVDGVAAFIDYAVHNLQKMGNIDLRVNKQHLLMPCPCTKCLNHIEHKVEEVQFHLFRNGIDLSYTNWTRHGEKDEPSISAPKPVNATTEFVDDTDFASDIPTDGPATVEMVNATKDNFDEDDLVKFQELLLDAEKPLYEGCPDFTKLSAIVKLLNLKGKYGASDKFFTELLGLIKKMLPAGNEMVEKTYQAKKVMKLMGSGYKKIHVCINNCLLYWKDDKDLTACRTCGISRWKVDNKTHKVYENIPAKTGVDTYDASIKDNFNLRAVVLWTINDYPALGTLCGCWYRRHNSVPHCIDFMHIEKNVVESLVGTLLNVPGKMKDRVNAQLDLAKLGVKPELFSMQEEDKTTLPPVGYTLTNDEKDIFCEMLYNIRVPQGYCSNFSSLVSLKDRKLIGLKSHDYHMLMQEFLAIAIHSIMHPPTRYAIIKFCFFFKSICSKEIRLQELDKMQAELVVTVCLLKKFFLPSFFDIMIHLTMHLTRENENGSVSVQVGGLDHQSMEVASHFMYSEHLDKNWNEVSENHHVDGLDHQSVEAVSQVTSVNKDLAEESESAAIDGLISLQSHDIHSQPFLSPSKVTKLINELFTSPNDSGFSQANSIFGYVDVDNMDKDGCITDVKTMSRPFLRQRRLADGNEIALLPWNEDLTRSPNAPKRLVSVPEEIMLLFCDKKKMEMQWTFPWLDGGYRIQMDFWERLVGRSSSKRGWLADDAMASPYLSDMLSRYELPLYYADGIKYGVPWFASGVEKVYFPVNEKDFHWCLAELHIRSGVITFYDSLGGPSNGIEDRLFWLELRQIFDFHIPTYMDYADVFVKKNIDKTNYSIRF